jgi:hypothetical protein
VRLSRGTSPAESSRFRVRRLEGCHARRARCLRRAPGRIAGPACSRSKQPPQFDLLIIEIHNLNLDTRAGEELSDHLKYFTEHLPATFVYAGIDVERSGLSPEPAAASARDAAVSFTPVRSQMPKNGASWSRRWRAPCGCTAHPPGTLVAEARYLHRRTGGMIGSLAHLIRAAAISAMLDGTEHVTRALMDTVLIDCAAHTAAARTVS